MQGVCARAIANYFEPCHHPAMDKQTAIKKAGGVQALAKLLDVSHQAIYAWRGKLPKMRLFQLQVLRPEWFKGRKG
jgi:hypothetical protein